MGTMDMILRLLVAFSIGGALGLNRDLHKKSAGLRTIGLVSLATCMLVVAAGGVGPGMPGFAFVTPIIQGSLTGIGFLGAGVIVRGAKEGEVHGLTTAAVIWLAAGFGILCGIGAWTEVAWAVVLAFLCLVVGGRIEKWAYMRVHGGNYDDADVPSSSANQRPPVAEHAPAKS